MNRFRNLFTMAALLLAAGCFRAGLNPFAETKFDQDYAAWSTVLGRYVTADGVDYAALKDQRPLLDDALDAMRAVRKRQFDGWSAGARLAFLANAHNAFAIDRILRAYPVASLAKTQSWTSARESRDIVLLGRKWSLADLAGECMSDRYLESRAIFLLNWAAAGCTPLPPVAVTENNLSTLLDRQPRRFLADETHCQYDIHGGIIHLSPLIDEIRDPIKRDFTTPWEFLKRYLPPDQAAQVALVPPRIRWLEFDDALNDAHLRPVTRIESDETQTSPARADAMPAPPVETPAALPVRAPLQPPAEALNLLPPATATPSPTPAPTPLPAETPIPPVASNRSAVGKMD